MCEKNPSHTNYMPVFDMTLETLPDVVKKQSVVDFLISKSMETVRIVCNRTSEARPAGYTFYNYRGKRMFRYGSGRIWSVYVDKIKTDIPCPFEDCTVIDGPHFVHGYLRVHTAMHVVFDDIEAQATTIDFFYDKPDDRSTVITARGVKVVKSDVDGDYCVMDCVTHDVQLCQKLDSIRKTWAHLWPEVKDFLYGKDISFVVSHPHGREKQMSIGKCCERNWGKGSGDQGWYKYAFTAATCPGSSGAPVWVPGRDGLFSGYAPHSGYDKKTGLNISCVWYFWKENSSSEDIISDEKK
ncbi:uncharacterized protein LOC131929795 isoform X2 [Physella acuta]|nr:uncharacterized protein LOC131929795 isoform X2 [Physella acuta]